MAATKTNDFLSSEQDETFFDVQVSQIIFPELTPKETEFLHWFASGIQYKQIADLAHVVPRTAQKKIKHIAVKLSVENSISLKVLYHQRTVNYQIIQSRRIENLLLSILSKLEH